MKNEKALFISPHIDDIAFSLGGILLKFITRYPTFIVNVFSTSRYAYRTTHSNSESVTRMRTQEERLFNQATACDTVSLGFQDASMLNHTDTSEVYTNFYDRRYKSVCTALQQQLSQLRPTYLFVPLSLGGHIDHKMVFDIITHRTRYSSATQIFYYEDLPYAYFESEERRQAYMQKRLLKGLVRHRIDITAQMACKLKNAHLYASQVTGETICALKKHARTNTQKEKYFEYIWSQHPGRLACFGNS